MMSPRSALAALAATAMTVALLPAVSAASVTASTGSPAPRVSTQAGALNPIARPPTSTVRLTATGTGVARLVGLDPSAGGALVQVTVDTRQSATLQVGPTAKGPFTTVVVASGAGTWSGTALVSTTGQVFVKSTAAATARVSALAWVADAEAGEQLGAGAIGIAVPVTGLLVLREPGAEVLGPRLATRMAVRSVNAFTRISDTRAIGSRVEVVRFAEAVSEKDAQAMATALERLPDVVSVSPDLPINVQVPRPRIASTSSNGPEAHWHLGAGPGAANINDVFYAGIRGRGVVVAVIDSGVTAHADIQSKLLPGYDFISDVWQANDGDGWDPNPADPGDAVTEADKAQYPQELANCRAGDSSWHGTKVTSLIAGQGDKISGMRGVAPEIAGVVPVRVLGRCGAWRWSNVLAAITWASGGQVTGVPANAHPARIINMSLGGPGLCDDVDSAIVREARNRGSLIVASAGNDASFVSQNHPANCPGIVSVGALNEYGLLPKYTNVGDDTLDVTLMAAGGDDTTGVPVATNSGLTGPASDAYAADKGTSFAAPIVAGAAALLASTGVTDPDLLEAHLKAATSAPANSGGYRGVVPCSQTYRCGAGRLNLMEVFSNLYDLSNASASRERPAAPVVRVSSWKRAGKHRQVTLTWDSPTSAALCRRALAPDYIRPSYPDNDLAGLWTFQVVMSRESGASLMRLLIKQKNCTGRRFTTIVKALPSTRSVVMIRSFRSGEEDPFGTYQASDWTSLKLRSPS